VSNAYTTGTNNVWMITIRLRSERHGPLSVFGATQSVRFTLPLFVFGCVYWSLIGAPHLLAFPAPPWPCHHSPLPRALPDVLRVQQKWQGRDLLAFILSYICFLLSQRD
jgi:hypothetical protein